MARRILNIPLFLILMGICALMMMMPVVHAISVRDWLSARMFFYSGLLGMILVVLIGIASYANKPRSLARAHLLALLAAFTLLPVFLAIPFYESLRTTSFLNAYVEMVSSLTTTGATLFEPDRLPPTLHLWRAIVGWMGGFMVWVTAAAILAPMNLGGFEVTSAARIGQGAGFERSAGGPSGRGDPRERLLRYALKLLPIYVGLTGALWIGLLASGEVPLVAICHAMSVLATSGISPVGGMTGASAGITGEAIILCFLILALTRKTFSVDKIPQRLMAIRSDSEFRLGLFLLVLLTSLLFLRHWIGAYEVEEEADLRAALRALWGAFFSLASFLTTTGFESGDWETARAWSGLRTPGLILAGLALVGGGVATTAGGIKLLRVYALYKHGVREMERLIHPSSVGGAGTIARQIRRKGAYVAWIFFMLFMLSFAAVTILFSAAGLSFEDGAVLSIAALSTTGPVAQVVTDTPVDLAGMSAGAKGIFAGAMVLGRLEALAIIALLNPAFWRA